MAIKQVCVLGGSGFVGRHLIARLVKDGYNVRVLTRQRERHRDLLVLPTVELIEADVYNPVALQTYFQGQDAVINLVGILNEPRDNGKGFTRAHVELTRLVIAACRHCHIPRLLHMSALHANANTGPSYYLRSKGVAEDLLRAVTDMHTTCFRPSVIFGPGDSFFNNFATLLRLSPGVVPLACAQARFAPIYIGDVVSAFAQSLSNPHTYGQCYDLCGPQTFTLKQLVQYTATQINVHRWVLGLGKFPSWLLANLLQYMPLFRPLTRDNYRSLQVDSVCSQPFPATFNLTPRRLDEIVPTYLGGKTSRQQYNILRQRLHDK
jgi:uncharacterized protein YbjT (DUF2867 family)